MRARPSCGGGVRCIVGMGWIFTEFDGRRISLSISTRLGDPVAVVILNGSLIRHHNFFIFLF